jgi:hypothetical protein
MAMAIFATKMSLRTWLVTERMVEIMKPTPRAMLVAPKALLDQWEWSIAFRWRYRRHTI